MQLRTKTLSDLREKLDDSYFTAESFNVSNTPEESPFLTITFLPSTGFAFRVYAVEDGQVMTEESPGNLLASGEQNTYKTLSSALNAVGSWTRRIREEYLHGVTVRNEVDDFMEQFRAKAFNSDDDKDPGSYYSQAEVAELRSGLDRLKALIAAQAEQLDANSNQISAFEKEIDRIKEDLEGMPRGVWRKVASNKLIKSVKGFMGTPEGRKLIADGLKKLIGME